MSRIRTKFLKLEQTWNPLKTDPGYADIRFNHSTFNHVTEKILEEDKTKLVLFQIVGYSKTPGFQEFVQAYKENIYSDILKNAWIQLERDFDNCHDKEAIKVIFRLENSVQDKRFLGWVPRKINKILNDHFKNDYSKLICGINGLSIPQIGFLSLSIVFDSTIKVINSRLNFND